MNRKRLLMMLQLTPYVISSVSQEVNKGTHTSTKTITKENSETLSAYLKRVI